MNVKNLIIEGLHENRKILNESAKDAVSIDKYDTDITKDDKGVFYFKGKEVKSPEDAESMLYYIEMNLGTRYHKTLSKDECKELFNTVFKAIPNGYNITEFGERGLVTRCIKNGTKIEYVDYKGNKASYDGAWYLMNGTEMNGNSYIFSKNKAPDNIKYTDISKDFGKTHNFNTEQSIDYKGKKKIEYDDDVVVIYKNGKEIYKGIEDNDPMKRENWKWDSKNKVYTLGNDYVKMCL